jgi:type I restriction enzyme, S subunit
MEKIPPNWEKTTINEITLKMRAGGTPRKSHSEYYSNGKIPFVKIQDLSERKKYLTETENFITSKGLENSSAWLVPKNTILYSMYGSYGIPQINRIPVSTNQAIIALILPEKLIDINYIYYYLIKMKPEIQHALRGTTQQNLSKTRIKKFEINIAPYNEQKRIVKRIEKLLSRIESSENTLKKTGKKLKLFSSSVIFYSFIGVLTNKWRENNLSIANIGYKKILELDKRSDRKYNNVYSDFKLPKLPQGWKYIQMSKLVENPRDDIVDGPFGSNLKTSDYTKSGVPIIKIQNVERNRFINTNIDYISKEKSEELKRHSYKKGQIVITKLGDPLGRACIVPDHVENGVIVADIVRIRNINKIMDKKYLTYLINSPLIANQLATKVKGTTRPRVNLTHIRGLQVPICSIEEQQKIVQNLDKYLTNISSIDIHRQTQNIDNLKYSILVKAFKGNLVPQDPGDEPASKLLERIKAEKQGKKQTRLS